MSGENTPGLPDPLETLRAATRGTEYEGRLYLVGGYVRDKLLGDAAASDDYDLVLEGDALRAARFLWKRGVTDHRPVEYGQFGTTQIEIHGQKVELVTARAETYRQGSRKPVVTPGTLQTDAERRDFTVNTFLENLHTGEISDPTGKGGTDLAAKILRTPLDPSVTFAEDPLRMLRACRFAAKLGFTVAPEAYAAILENARRCDAEHGISFERMRDEFTKTLLTSDAPLGLEMMRVTGLLSQFAPELAGMHGVTQNRFHRYEVWEHTMVALRHLPREASLLVRLATLFHDIGKPRTRTVDAATGDVHFYGHEEVGAEMAREVMTRLRFSLDEIKAVTQMVGLHMRYGAYDPAAWTDASVRRLVRTVGEHRRDLFTIARADIAACGTGDFPTADLDGLSERMERLEAESQITRATSPLDGGEIMLRLDLKPGPLLGKVKEMLTDAVVGGELAPDDKSGAEQWARAYLARIADQS
ncbi:MAG: HDIG domain-containing protein [Cytophagales bacterium]|nr:HDIG domain-containing protein [Armatimonadota bacterium]